MLPRAWAIAAVVVAVGPLFAAEPPTSDQIKPAADLKPMQERLDRLEQKIDNIDKQLTRLLESNIGAMQREMNDLRELVANMRREMGDLRSTSAREPYTARKPIESLAATVTLVNEHPYMMMNAMVNGELHALPPGGTKAVPVSAGTLTLQVRETDALPRMRTLQPRENKIVTMH